MDLIIENKEWIFSGVGVFALSGIIALFVRLSKRRPTQVQKSGHFSNNLQSGRDISIKNEND